MAYIENTAFEVKISNHEFDSIANITGKFQSDGADAEICPGFLCIRDTLVPNEGYENIGPVGSETTLYNTNTWNMKEATDSDDTTAQKGVFACNPFDVNMASDGQGNFWKVGANTLSIKVPAGYLTTWTRIHFNNNNVYRFGIGNLSDEIGENKFFTISEGKLHPASSVPSGSAGIPYFELIRTGTFTEGAYAAFDYVDVRACASES